MTVWAYARVSTRDQNPQLQLDALEASGYDELISEKESGKRGVARPEWEALLPLPQAGDTLKFWKSDRWGRSAGHVLTTVTELRERGVKVVSLTENFDLDTKEGRFMFAVLAAAAEYELELRAERQAEGIAAAQRREADGRMLPGKQRIGRPHVLGPAELDMLRRLVDEGVSVTEAARRMKIGRSTAYQALAAVRRPAELPGGDGRAELEAALARLPVDTRPAPSVAAYDDLLTGPETGAARPDRAIDTSSEPGGDRPERGAEREAKHEAEMAAVARRAEQERERWRSELLARVKPLPEFGEGYGVARDHDSGKHWLIHQAGGTAELVGYAAKKTFTTRWQAHGRSGHVLPGTGTYDTARQALVQVGVVDQLSRKRRRRR